MLSKSENQIVQNILDEVSYGIKLEQISYNLIVLRNLVNNKKLDITIDPYNNKYIFPVLAKLYIEDICKDNNYPPEWIIGYYNIDEFLDGDDKEKGLWMEEICDDMFSQGGLKYMHVTYAEEHGVLEGLKEIVEKYIGIKFEKATP